MKRLQKDLTLTLSFIFWIIDRSNSTPIQGANTNQIITNSLLSTFQVSSDESSQNECPQGFVKHRSSCYHLVEASGRLTWDIANDYCQLHGSELVSIETADEQFYIERLISRQTTGESAYWLGATNRHLPAGTWKWEATGQTLGYTLWISIWSSWAYEVREPSCAILDTSEHYQWMFWPCHNNYYMLGQNHSEQSGIGLICEKALPESRSRSSTRSAERRRRRHKRKGRGRHRKRDRNTGA